MESFCNTGTQRFFQVFAKRFINSLVKSSFPGDLLFDIFFKAFKSSFSDIGPSHVYDCSPVSTGMLI